MGIKLTQQLTFKSIANSAIKVLGFGHTLYVGKLDELSRELRKEGLFLTDVVVNNNTSDITLNLERLLRAKEYDSVFFKIDSDLVNFEYFKALLPLVLNSKCKNILIYININSPQHQEKSFRSCVEEHCFGLGFRKHPCYYEINSYDSLNNDINEFFIPLEREVVKSHQDHISSKLEGEYLLHQDMLKRSGRRSDAHCVRYHMAAKYIQYGDTVLDVACGLGYGSHILFHNSQARNVIGVDISKDAIEYADARYANQSVRFYEGSADSLKSIESNSVDFIAAFETIEHLENPLLYLSELKRVLKPSGRVLICAPNNWVDETGRDPNPFHLHVYTIDKLKAECAQFFILEKMILQTAGGALKCHHGERQWIEQEVEQEPLIDSEWIMFLCMRDPAEGKGIEYVESTWRLPSDPNFHVSAFRRDYDNPWIVKGLVYIGRRVSSSVQLNRLQKKVLQQSAPSSVDYGAALCGLVYSEANKSLSYEASSELFEKIDRYSSLQIKSPHVLRWQLSLLFAGGELALTLGFVSKAIDYYKQCLQIDVTSYSPLLGNKVIDAAFRLATLGCASKDFVSAKQHLLFSIKKAKEYVSGSWLNIIGDDNYPLVFGFPEIAQIMDKASRAAYLLNELNSESVRPNILYVEALGFYERQIKSLESHRDNLDSQVARLNNEKDRLNQALIDFDKKAREDYSYILQLATEIKRLDTLSNEIAALVQIKDEVIKNIQASYERDVTNLTQQLNDQVTNADHLANEITNLDQTSQQLAGEVRRKDEVIKEIQASYERDVTYLTQQLSDQVTNAGHLANKIANLDQTSQQLAGEVRRKDDIIKEIQASYERDVTNLTHQLNDQVTNAGHLANEIANLDQVSQQLATEVRHKEEVIKEIQASYERDVTNLTQQLSDQIANADHLANQIANLDQTSQQLAIEVRRKDDVIKEIQSSYERDTSLLESANREHTITIDRLSTEVITLDRHGHELAALIQSKDLNIFEMAETHRQNIDNLKRHINTIEHQLEKRNSEFLDIESKFNDITLRASSLEQALQYEINKPFLSVIFDRVKKWKKKLG